MSEEYEYSKMYFSDDYKFDEDDDEVFVSNTTASSTTSSEDASSCSSRGIIIPSRTRRVSDVIDSLNESPTSPNIKRHSFADFSFSSTKKTTIHTLKESKSESDSIYQRLSLSSNSKTIMESRNSKLLLPSTPGSDQGYGSCLPTPTQMVYRPNRIFRYSSSSTSCESHQVVSQTDAQPSTLPNEDHSEHRSRHDSDIEVPMPVAKDSFEYNMDHIRRGRAIIFNHDEFKGDNMAPRPGSLTDVKNLENVFYNLGFDVSVYNNPEFKDIIEILNNLSEEDHSDADCLMITVLTHGLGERYLWANDMPYFVEKLWLPFTADKCKTLAGKPKIFFIQACRGTKLDGGVTLVSRPNNTETDSGANAYKIPSYADFLIAYSTVEGFYSWRHPENGTWFIQCLCQELADSGSKLDLLSIMTRVSRRVALDMESYNDLLAWQHQQKQVPSINSMLIRDVIFKPKPKTI